ncbi:hypothetical protein G7009_27140 [Pseudomonas capeferrum]|uniref:hypothetical protein n=1 Tax=Pseudomonas capeferrum TaxID=1495066 RepID=UPI0015E27308|nr:hypothetical protein [Pseudomonas capeferrum]MBA1205386.1 hypothetical protein [Pseudomonas capeferrum]
MSNSTTSALTEWMQKNPDLLGWESITAVPLAQANRLLNQSNIRRLSLGQDINSLSGAIEMEMSDVAYHLADYHLSVQALSVSRASYDTARIDMLAHLQGGTLVKAEKPYKVLSLSVHDALDRLAVTLEMYPQGKDGALIMDIAKGENVRLAVTEDPAGQAQAGSWLQGQLERQDQEKRDVVLAEGAADSPALGLGTAALRTQTGPEGPALLVFASSQSGRGGSFPGQSTGFPNLLAQCQPDEAAQLLNMRLLHRNSFRKGFTEMLVGGRFEEMKDETGMLTGLSAEAGELRIPATHYQSRDYLFNGEAFQLHTAGGLVASFEQNAASQRWQGECSIAFSCLPNDADVPLEFEATFELDLPHRFYLVASTEPDRGMLEGQFFAPWPHAQEARAVRGLPDEIDDELKAQAEDFAAHAVKQAILIAMAKTLDSRSPEQWVESLQIGGAGHLQATAFEHSAALAVFGPLRAGAAFGIDNDDVKLLAGARHTFVVENPPEGELTWSLRSLPGGPSNPGTIDQGAYRAPPKHTLQGRSGHVLVQVSDGKGAQAAAIVTVLQNELTANPFITTLQANEERVLTAAALGDVEVQWAHANEVPGESGELTEEAQGRRCRYKATPAVENKTYVLDEIHVRSAGSDEAQSLYVLAIQRLPGLVVTLAEEPRGDAMQFVAYLNGRPFAAKWRLGAGSGQIDEATGLYQPGSGNQAPGILVFAEVDTGGLGIFEGHLIMPLGIARFPALSRQMLAAPAKSA